KLFSLIFNLTVRRGNGYAKLASPFKISVS
ncbi:MAG: hypothetical protein ACI9BG_001518, partial [Parasphingorhabdus sp.]